MACGCTVGLTVGAPVRRRAVERDELALSPPVSVRGPRNRRRESRRANPGLRRGQACARAFHLVHGIRQPTSTSNSKDHLSCSPALPPSNFPEVPRPSSESKKLFSALRFLSCSLRQRSVAGWCRRPPLVSDVRQALGHALRCLLLSGCNQIQQRQLLPLRLSRTCTRRQRGMKYGEQRESVADPS